MFSKPCVGRLLLLGILYSNNHMVAPSCIRIVGRHLWNIFVFWDVMVYCWLVSPLVKRLLAHGGCLRVPRTGLYAIRCSLNVVLAALYAL